MLRKRYVIPAAAGASVALAVAVGVMTADAAAVTPPAVLLPPSSSPPAPSSSPPSAFSSPAVAAVEEKAVAVEESCESGGAIVAGSYWLSNNQWGRDAGSGTQCVRLLGDAPAWSTDWRWSGEQNAVKSYASAVLGWHWGWKVPRERTGLPVRLSSGTPVTSTWDFTVTPADPGTMNVAYDLWLHDVGDPDWEDQPTDEVMVWLYRSGGAGPLGTREATVTLGGADWDLYRGDIGWNVFSFVRTANTTSAALELTDFTAELTKRGWMPDSRYLSSVQAGTEVFTGAGELDTDGYAVRVG